MAMHPSLKLSEKDKKSRSVLKRIERIRTMMAKDQWKEGDKVYGLPKIKTLRIKIKKEKVEKAETAPTAAEGATPTESAEVAKEQPAKGPASRTQDKK
jgi:small basic protein (TIGR04137 family)